MRVVAGRLVWTVCVAWALGACDKPKPKAVVETPREAPSEVERERPLETPRYVGSASCAPCHAPEMQAFHGSHHDLAMQEPTAESVLGDFSGKTVKGAFESFTFRRTEDAYWVDVCSGKAEQSYRVKYVFGVEPLQQLLLDVGDGRLQALTVAWDARDRKQGGQRWFSLQPDERVPPGDPLHWLGPQYNWNAMCADCHSTGLIKGYAPASHSYTTRFAEIDVACEACHGPSSLHVAQAKAGKASVDVPGFRALERGERRWVFAKDAPIAHLEGARAEEEQEVCAACHSRRAELGPIGPPYHDRYRLSLLDDPLYFDDGQVRDEVYVYGSFLQSRMHAAGVTCSDCHEPHSLTLRAPGNAVCAQCHRPDVFDSPAHHFHPEQSSGAQCVSCHMPLRTYMVIDERREHRFSVPRPDLSARVQSPDACTSHCHQQKSPAWAAGELKARGHLRTTAHFASALHRARQQQPFAEEALAGVVKDRGVPAIVRATALAGLARFPGPRLLKALQDAPRDASPLVRRAAAEALAHVPDNLREDLGKALLADRYRSVRDAAAQSFIGVDTSHLSTETQARLRAALREYRESAEYRADRAEGLASLANLSMAHGEAEPALRLLGEALARDPSFTAAYVNRADLYRALGREGEAEAVLRAGLTRAADKPAIEHALGLSLVRSGSTTEALAHLAAAHRARPEDTRFAFVYAVALFDTQEPEAALRVLRATLEKAPGDPQLLGALVDYCTRLGRPSEAREYSERLRELRGGS